ncbi:bifunctional adenosylcobinamide kinase/adenosylcobinamide-phosphate guanylyltransferase [Shewanella intestini]|uniref:Bifunctional adenosylcobalamin biosynthesis protein n=1 Tax=Shewanella intestini TaxID=2017544 RepID=A0ABS5I1P2_9GAMM|nr:MULTISPECIES: bifunctional adenosylcobinamide kinase/adenosylcobinamide-phosphate guanylyltransferase [Shewanella]MBR9727948.1 bifunctional adenosylcobinamide kinase/adenosylcobinamide-phosphate guanylyltransferase [Shewanella intestini]MRG36501.1 bifunctional adenosylcobinamide kinase/adenosylcobinamide-phosphate guanylyltransferase [Shewanella sp. XMDDZSB0408]
MISLYIGGARSGKSAMAEQALASCITQPITYIATANATRSMSARIALHQQQRPSQWQTLEAPLALAETLQQIDYPDNVIIVDCLTLWLTNQLLAKHNLTAAVTQLCNTLRTTNSHIVLVSTDVGQSLIPDDDMSRAFVNASGLMLQHISAIADNVYYCQAKQPIVLKGLYPANSQLTHG